METGFRGAPFFVVRLRSTMQVVQNVSCKNKPKNLRRKKGEARGMFILSRKRVTT